MVLIATDEGQNRRWVHGHSQHQPGSSQPGHTHALTSDWFTSSSGHFCHRGHLSLSSNVVSLEVQQHCSWLYQKADRQMPSFRSVIQSTARSMTPARVPGRNSKHHWDGSRLDLGSTEGEQRCPRPGLPHAQTSFSSLGRLSMWQGPWCGKGGTQPTETQRPAICSPRGLRSPGGKDLQGRALQPPGISEPQPF